MVQASHQKASALDSEAELFVIAYVEAAEGDLSRALLWALEDLIDCETRLALVRASVSQGFIRAALRNVSRPGR